MTSLREFDALLEANETAPAQARRLVTETLDGHSDGSDLPLLVSELVTNAVRHGAGAHVILRLILRGSRLRIEVRQTGEFDQLIPGSSGGFGLKIVDALSDAWGKGEGWNGVWLETTIEAA